MARREVIGGIAQQRVGLREDATPLLHVGLEGRGVGGRGGVQAHVAQEQEHPPVGVALVGSLEEHARVVTRHGVEPADVLGLVDERRGGLEGRAGLAGDGVSFGEEDGAGQRLDRTFALERQVRAKERGILDDGDAADPLLDEGGGGLAVALGGLQQLAHLRGERVQRHQARAGHGLLGAGFASRRRSGGFAEADGTTDLTGREVRPTGGSAQFPQAPHD